jgi:hypothetical protein
MGVRNDIKVGTDMQELDIVAEHGHAAGTTVVSRVAVFEGIGTAQPKAPDIVARQT